MLRLNHFIRVSGPSRPGFFLLTAGFAAGIVTAVVVLLVLPSGFPPAPSAARGAVGAGDAAAHRAHRRVESDAPQPWLPSRTFECPGCGGAVRANDNTLPILLLGFLGQGAFGLRFFVQWIASERARASVIPEIFWWLSIAGGVLLLMYGWALLAWPLIIGQGLNCLIYGRNLAFVRAAGQDATCEKMKS